MDGDCHDDGLRSLECVVQSDMFGWFGLDSLTDRRKSVGTEDDGGIGDDDIRSVMLMVTDFWAWKHVART